MSGLRSFSILRSLSLRSSIRSITSPRYIQQNRLYAQSSYGGGEGDPKGEDPQNQGSNPSAGLEHPGPPPPEAGQGTGGGPTKANKDGHNTLENESSGGGGKTDASSSKGANSGAQPKIHSHSPPAELSEEAKKHNEDFNNRYGAQDKAGQDEKQEVGKGFWSGEILLYLDRSLQIC